MSRFYTINEIAEMFGVTRTAVYDWMNAGRLDYFVVGSRRRITQEALDAFIQSGTQAKKQETTEKNETPELVYA